MKKTNDGRNEPVRPNEDNRNDAVAIGGLADEKRLRENEEALDAAFADEDGDEETFMKKMRRKYKEKSEKDQGDPNPGADESEEDEENETRAAKAVRDPGEVTSREIEQHRMKNHLPFRIWCPYCLAAKGKERPHVKGKPQEEGEDNGIPQFGLDYGFSRPD